MIKSHVLYRLSYGLAKAARTAASAFSKHDRARKPCLRVRIKSKRRPFPGHVRRTNTLNPAAFSSLVQRVVCALGDARRRPHSALERVRI